jgi:hypothetical protein
VIADRAIELRVRIARRPRDRGLEQWIEETSAARVRGE